MIHENRWRLVRRGRSWRNLPQAQLQCVIEASSHPPPGDNISTRQQKSETTSRDSSPIKTSSNNLQPRGRVWENYELFEIQKIAKNQIFLKNVSNSFKSLKGFRCRKPLKTGKRTHEPRCRHLCYFFSLKHLFIFSGLSYVFNIFVFYF